MKGSSNNIDLTRKAPFQKTKDDYQEDILKIGKQHVFVGLIIHSLYVVIVSLIRYFFAGKGENEMSPYAKFGIIACGLNIFNIFILKTNHKIFTTVITINSSIGVYIITETMI